MAVRVIRGDTWVRTWLVSDPHDTPIDLSGCTARLQVRDAADAVVLEASTGNGRIQITPASGRIDMSVPASVMEAPAPGGYAFDLEVTFADGRRQTFEQDTLVVQRDITRD